MIRDWLIKHWWLNELGKLIVVVAFGYIAYSSYEVSITYNQNLVAFASGIMATLALFVAVDIGAVLLKVIRGQEPYK